MGVVPPLMGFLETLREETRRHGSLLIFDEVITGFRLAGAAPRPCRIEPDSRPSARSSAAGFRSRRMEGGGRS
jgi:glutamate-1-semialdehyde 2,1-aminomutase